MKTKTCTISGKNFVIRDDDLKFYEKIGVPEPTLCPEERFRRRYIFRNERHLYRRTCAATKKQIISFYHSESPVVVYERDYWWSDNWDPLKYGQEYDFSKPFFEQFKQLYARVPKMSLMTSHCENCTYGPYGVYSKNCYMAISCNHSEDVYYSYQTNFSTDSIDCCLSHKLELCYECFACENCFELKYSSYCQNCSNSAFLKYCIGCSDCFGCVNLKNKQYCFLNKQYSKEAYQEKIAGLALNNFQGLEDLKQSFAEYTKDVSVKYLYGTNNENVSGNMLSSCKNALDCYESVHLEDCRFVGPTPDPGAKDCYDMNYSPYAELCYEGMSGVLDYGSVGMLHAWDLNNAFYCNECFGGNDLFGCIGLRKKQYCILNKQYTEEEYNVLKEKIIKHMKKTGEWGEFFPTSISPFSYNETVAHEYFPLTQEESLKQGYGWKDADESATYEGPKYNLPDDIKEVSDDILEAILTCERTGKHYRIIKPELDFYRKMNIPLPRICPDERYRLRMKLRNPRTLWEGSCPKCNKDIQTTYDPQRPEKVLCEACYLDKIN